MDAGGLLGPYSVSKAAVEIADLCLPSYTGTATLYNYRVKRFLNGTPRAKSLFDKLSLPEPAREVALEDVWRYSSSSSTNVSAMRRNGATRSRRKSLSCPFASGPMRAR